MNLIKYLLSKTTPKTYKKGIIILDATETPQNLIYVHSGLLKSYYEHKGKEYITQFHFENLFVLNISSLISQSKSMVTIETIEDSELYKIPIYKLQDEQSKQLLSSLLLKQAQEQQKRILSLLTLSNEQRYRQILLERPDLILRVKQTLLAMYLGCEAETLSRIKKRITKT